jgi:hypothetical protein
MNTKVDHIAIMCVVGKGQAIAPKADPNSKCSAVLRIGGR